MRVAKTDIAATIRKLIQSGKTMPQMDRLRASSNPTQTAEAILRETVDLWWDVFGERNISVEHWKKAEAAALTMSGVPGLNLNTISTNLMSVALRQADEARIQERVTQCRQQTIEPPGDIDYSDYGKWKTATLWAWTKKKLKYGSPIMKYLPTENDIALLSMELRLTREQRDKNRALLQMHLADVKYCKDCRACNGRLPCYLERKPREISVQGGNICFTERWCEQ